MKEDLTAEKTLAVDAWDVEIKAKRSRFSLRLREMWRYRDLLMLFVRRDFLATYKQTVLGPLWFFIQPILTAITLTLVFGRLAGLSTAGYPKLLFYLSGIIGWSYFADCLTKTSSTFVTNAALFTKVYFPRLIVPVSIVISNLIRFVIQLIVLVGFIGYYMLKGYPIHPNLYLLLVPFLLLLMAGLGLAFGLLISSLTTKYRDFQFLISFSVTLMMYFSPVLFPLVSFQDPKHSDALVKTVIMYNPMTSVIETFRYAFLGSDQPFALWGLLGYSFCFMIVLFLVSVYLFNRVERTFSDSV